MASSYQHTSPTNTLNLLSSSAEEFGLHNDRLLWELSLPQNFAVARSHHINDGSSSGLVFDSAYPCLPTDQGPRFIRVDSGAEALVPLSVVMPHTNFPKVTWVIFVKVDPVMMQATSIASASRVLPVLADVAMAVAHVAPKFLGLPQSGWHVGG